MPFGVKLNKKGNTDMTEAQLKAAVEKSINDEKLQSYEKVNEIYLCFPDDGWNKHECVGNQLL